MSQWNVCPDALKLTGSDRAGAAVHRPSALPSPRGRNSGVTLKHKEVGRVPGGSRAAPSRVYPECMLMYLAQGTPRLASHSRLTLPEISEEQSRAETK